MVLPATQSAHLALMSVGHFAVGALFGVIVDQKIMGPLSVRERMQALWCVAKIAVQVLLLALVRHYVGALLARYPMAGDHIVKHDGGWAFTVGIVSTQRNLLARLSLVADTWAPR